MDSFEGPDWQLKVYAQRVDLRYWPEMGKHSSIRRGSWRDAARIVTKSNLALGAVLAVLSWPYDKIALMPAYGMDPGWSAALEMVAHQRLPFGTHAVFAYGPLGFLAVWPVYFTWPAIVGFLFQFSLYSSVFAALIWALRRVIPIVAAIILAFVAGAISINAVAFIYSGEPEKALALALIGCIYTLTRAADEPVPKRLWVALGVGVGIFCLLKISIGLGIAVALVITVACLSRGKLRALAWIAPAALATFAIGWFATGNGFANIVGYVRGDLSTIAGYGAAVSVEDPTRWYTYWYAAAVVAIVAALAVGRCWSLPRRAQVGVGLVTLFVVWQLFKEAFVRHDIYHDPIFFAVAPLFVIAFIPTRPTWKWSFAITGGVLATSVLAGALTSFPTQLTRPGTGAPDFANEVTTLVVPGDRSAEITTALGTAPRYLRRTEHDDRRHAGPHRGCRPLGTNARLGVSRREIRSAAELAAVQRLHDLARSAGCQVSRLVRGSRLFHSPTARGVRSSKSSI